MIKNVKFVFYLTLAFLLITSVGASRANAGDYVGDFCIFIDGSDGFISLSLFDMGHNYFLVSGYTNDEDLVNGSARLFHDKIKIGLTQYWKEGHAVINIEIDPITLKADIYGIDTEYVGGSIEADYLTSTGHVGGCIND